MIPTERLRTARGEPVAARLTGKLPAALWALAAVALVPVLFYSFVLPLTPVRLAQHSAALIDLSALWRWIAGLHWPVPTQARLATSLLLVGGTAFAAYGLAVVVCWRRRATRATLLAVVLPATTFMMLSAVALPTQSSDIVDYLLSGRVAATHGQSPYVVAPNAFPDDPLLPYANGTYTTDTEQKPPVWIGAAVGVAAVAGDQPARAVLTFRAFFLAMSLLNLGLIAMVLRRWRPDHLLAGLVLYGWNPIVTLHAQAKFDTVMATFALTAALLLVTGRRQASVAALWLSVLVKLLTLPLLAGYFAAELFAQRWRRLLVSAGLVGAITVAVYAPFDGGVTLLFDQLFRTERGGSLLPPVVRLVVTAAIALVVLSIGVKARDDPEQLLQGWALLSLAVVLLGPVGWSWYLITPIAIVSLSGERWRSLAVFGLSGLGFLFDTWIRSNSTAYPLGNPLLLSRTSIYLLLVVVAAAAVVAATAGPRWRGRRR